MTSAPQSIHPIAEPGIVERLRVWPAAYGEDAMSSTYVGGVMKQAADRIETLEAALRPFAQRADELNQGHLRIQPDNIVFSVTSPHTLGDYRRAIAALTTGQPK